MAALKTCSACGEIKDLTQFNKNRAMKDGLHPQCRECRGAYGRAFRQAHPGYDKQWREKHPHYRLGYIYGLTPEQFNGMVEAQNGACAICRIPFAGKPNVDHDHDTGKVRALLCHNCNRGLGMFAENPDSLRAAAEYIEKHRDVEPEETDPWVEDWLDGIANPVCDLTADPDCEACQ